MALRDTGFPLGPKEVLPRPQKGHAWKKIVAWSAAILIALLLVVLIGVTMLLHNTTFHNYVVRIVEQKASASLKTPIQLQNFSLHISNLSLDLYGLTVYGKGLGAGAPLL